MRVFSRRKNGGDGHLERPRYSEIESIDSPGLAMSTTTWRACSRRSCSLSRSSSQRGAGALAAGTVNVWVLVAAFAVALFAISTVRITAQWEHAVILRLGKFNRTAGPGLYLTIPFIEHIALRADLRTMLTGFGAEETLTSDLVPVDVDAAVFWMVWDAEKACMEVENYYDAVSIAAQTALRNAIGRKSISDVTIHRDKLDEELRDEIEEKAGHGVSPSSRWRSAIS